MCPNCEKKLSFKAPLLILTIVVLGVLGVESYAMGDHESHNHREMKDPKMRHSKARKEGEKPLAEAVKKTVVSVLEANERLHKSFFEYDASLVEKNAMKLKESIEAIEDKEIAKLLSYSKSKLAEIKATNDRKTNNKIYHLVSMALIHIVDKYEVGSNYKAYSCPMVKKRWIQNSTKMTKVHNPYAPKMPHCGSEVHKH